MAGQVPPFLTGSFLPGNAPRSGFPRRLMRLSEVLEATAPADAAASIVNKWADRARLDPRVSKIAGEIAALAHQTQQHLDEGRSDRAWHAVADMRQLEQDGYGLLLEEIVER